MTEIPINLLDECILWSEYFQGRAQIKDPAIFVSKDIFDFINEVFPPEGEAKLQIGGIPIYLNEMFPDRHVWFPPFKGPISLETIQAISYPMPCERVSATEVRYPAEDLIDSFYRKNMK